MRKSSWISCATALALSFGAGAQALGQGRMFFQGPYGVGGTYNVYEVRGAGDRSYAPGGRVGRFEVQLSAPVSFATGAAMSQIPAHNAAASVTEPISGTNKVAHLGAFSGALGEAEHAFVVQTLQLVGTNVLIGLSDDELFGGGESRTRPATGSDPTQNLENGCPNGVCTAEQIAGLAGQPGSAVNDGIGWQWMNDEPYTFHRWNGSGEPNDYATGLGVVAGTGEDATELLTNGLWNDIGDGDAIEGAADRAYLYEYETRSATPLTIPAANQAPTLGGTPLKTPGGTGGNGFMAIRELHSASTVSGVVGAANLLLGTQANDAEVNYTAATLNKDAVVGGSGGEFGGSDDFGLNTLPQFAGTDINNFALRAHGYLIIEEAGQYTFDVNTDDGGELWIYGQEFESVSGGEITTYGSLAYMGDRDNFNTLGVITLAKGEYEFEYIMNENGGGATAEFSAAKGAHTAFSQDFFSLVGADPAAVVFPGGTTARTGSDFQITEVLVQPDDSELLNTLAQAKAKLLAPDGDDVVDTGTSATINHSDPTTNGTASGRFGGDAPFLTDDNLGFDDDDFVIRATTTIVVETAGTYTFGFDSDDGAQIILEGAQFTALYGPGIVTDGGTALTADLLTGSSLSAASTFLAAGEYDLEFWSFERGGGAFAELFVAPGAQPGFSLQTHALLSGTSSTFAGFTRAGAIQLGDGIVDDVLLGDTNGDGVVDIVDLNNVRNNFGSTGLGDTDGNGTVDITDLNNVRNNFGNTAPAAATPEPSSLVLVGLGLAGLLAARRFRK